MAHDFTLTIDRFCGLQTGTASGAPVKNGASGKMKNFKITPEGHLTLRNGYSVLQHSSGRVRLLWHGTLREEKLYLALIGTELYASRDGYQTIRRVGTIEDTPHHGVCPIEFCENLYLLTGEEIYCFDGLNLLTIPPYRPLVRIGTPPSGGGVPFEDANFLSAAMRQSFSPDGESRTFQLAADRLRTIDFVRVGTRTVPPSEYQTDRMSGTVTFQVAPEAGTDTVEIGFCGFEDQKERILRCRAGIAYGGKNESRVFLYGDPEHPNTRYYSGLVDGAPSFTYFPESNYSLVGGGEPITSIIRHYDRQLIFTQNSTYYSYPETATDETGKEYLSFPVYTLSALKGNTVFGLDTLLNNRPLSVMPDGLYLWNSTSVRDERNAVCCSEAIASELIRRDLSHALYFNRRSQHELFVTFENEIYVYHYGLDLFYYYDGVAATAFLEDDQNRLFFGTAEGKLCLVCGYTDEEKPIEAFWESGCLYCGDFAHSKNLHFITVGADAEQVSPLHLEWSADNVVFPLISKYGFKRFGERLFSFRDLDFTNFLFSTARKQKSFTRRTPVRRFRYLKLRITHPAQASPITVFFLQLRGKINDQTI